MNWKLVINELRARGERRLSILSSDTVGQVLLILADVFSLGLFFRSNDK